jgi:hypothetical protein
MIKGALQRVDIVGDRQGATRPPGRRADAPLPAGRRREGGRFIVSEGVALLRRAQRVEPQLDAREILDQRPVVLTRMTRTQPPKQIAVDLHTRRRSHTESVGTDRSIRGRRKMSADGRDSSVADPIRSAREDEPYRPSYTRR